ncbi:MAG: hypothetical protein R3F01_11265 [Lysobacteraceae bacterium]
MTQEQSHDPAQELHQKILSRFEGRCRPAIVGFFRVRQQRARGTLYGFAPSNMGCLDSLDGLALDHVVFEAVSIWTYIALAPSQHSRGRTVFAPNFGGDHHDAGHGREGYAAHHALRWVRPLAALGEMCDPQNRAVAGAGQIDQRLQRPPNFRVVVAVASHGGDHRVDDQELDATDSLNFFLQAA